jgi:hypothetical protein
LHHPVEENVVMQDSLLFDLTAEDAKDAEALSSRSYAIHHALKPILEVKHRSPKIQFKP